MDSSKWYVVSSTLMILSNKAQDCMAEANALSLTEWMPKALDPYHYNRGSKVITKTQ